MKSNFYKYNFHLLFLIWITFIGNFGYSSSSYAMEIADKDAPKTPAYLCRTAGNKGEKDKRTVMCKYLSSKGSVKWTDTAQRIHNVYGPEFDQLNSEVEDQRKAVRSFNCHSNKGNVLTIVLAATGRSKDNKFQGYYANLRVGENGFKVTCNGTYKVATFFSESFNNGNIDGYAKTSSLNSALKTHELLEPECGHSRQKTHDGGCQGTIGHSECGALRGLMALPPDTFSRILPVKYREEVVFYEIHFISYWDACSGFIIRDTGTETVGCAVRLANALAGIKQRFGGNLFVFYHSVYYYDKAIYSLSMSPQLTSPFKDAKCPRGKKGWVVVSDDENNDDDKAGEDIEKLKKLPTTYDIQHIPNLYLLTIPNFYVAT